MINLTEGIIDLNAKIISIASNYYHINMLSDHHVLEKRKDPSGGEPYFYVETMDSDMRFGVTISMAKGKVEWLLLHWLDGPCTSKGWDEVSEKRLKEEYRSLLNFGAAKMGRPPNSKKNRECTWQLKWGEIKVSYEPRSFETAIFLVPSKVP